MNPLSEQILDGLQTRFGEHGKREFRVALATGLQKTGWKPRLVTQRFIVKNRNVILGDPETAEVIFTAHYDTPAAGLLPKIRTPGRPVCAVAYRVLYGLLIAAAAGLCALLPVFILTMLTALVEMSESLYRVLAALVGYLGCMLVLLAALAVPNTRNCNDNTSGVVTLAELAAALPKALRGRAAFVFFDNAETALLGSAAFRRSLSPQAAAKPVVNFDCVSEGDQLILTLPDGVDDGLRERLTALTGTFGEKRISLREGRKYRILSDHCRFQNGIGVGAFRATRSGLYLGRLHTRRDVVFDEENIRLLVGAMTALLAADEKNGQESGEREV